MASSEYWVDDPSIRSSRFASSRKTVQTALHGTAAAAAAGRPGLDSALSRLWTPKVPSVATPGATTLRGAPDAVGVGRHPRVQNWAGEGCTQREMKDTQSCLVRVHLWTKGDTDVVPANSGAVTKTDEGREQRLSTFWRFPRCRSDRGPRTGRGSSLQQTRWPLPAAVTSLRWLSTLSFGATLFQARQMGGLSPVFP